MNHLPSDSPHSGLKVDTGRRVLASVEYLPLLLTVLLATYAGFTSSDEASLLRWVIVLLGLMGTSLLVERITRLRRIDQRVSEITDLFGRFMSERIRATDFFLDSLPDLRHDIESSSTILVVAVNAEAFLVEYKNTLAERVREGAELKVITVNPSGTAVQQIANPSQELTVDYLEATARIAKQTLIWIEHERASQGSVELRYCDHVPMFSAYCFDRDSSRGKIVLGLYRQFWKHDRRPHAVLTRLHDFHWYTFYCAQVDEIWERGEAQSLVSTPSSA